MGLDAAWRNWLPHRRWNPIRFWIMDQYSRTDNEQVKELQNLTPC